MGKLWESANSAAKFVIMNAYSCLLVDNSVTLNDKKGVRDW